MNEKQERPEEKEVLSQRVINDSITCDGELQTMVPALLKHIKEMQERNDEIKSYLER